MTRRTHRSRCEEGQAAIEMAIVSPTMIFFVLGIVQLGLMQQARLLLEYAAFAAARAGSVWNADHRLMQDSALFVLTPTFGVSAENAAWGPRVAGADSAAAFARTYEAFRGVSRNGPLDLVRVDVLSPTREALGDRIEADFDEPADRALTQLTVRVTYFFNLRVPYANWIIWQSFMAATAGITFARRVDGWYGPGGVPMGRTQRLTRAGSSAKTPNPCYTNLSAADFSALTSLATTSATYLVPMVTTYTIRMQSNPIRDRLPRRADVLGGC